MLKQRTIQKRVEVTGIGLHSGQKVELSFNPAQENTGIVYRRVDLSPHIDIKCSPYNVKDTVLCTAIYSETGEKVRTIEHISSALASLGIDNLIIEVSADEVPIMDGSAYPFIYLIREAGIKELSANKKVIEIKKTVRVENGDKWAELRPYKKGFQVDLTIDFDHPAISGKDKSYKIDLYSESFEVNISRARTFAFKKDVELMRANNLALGGSLQNAVVLDEYKPMNPEGLRYENEMVRHKILDAIGDLYLCNHSIMGEMVAYKTGHGLNNQLIVELLNTPEAWQYVEIEEEKQSQTSEGECFSYYKGANI